MPAEDIPATVRAVIARNLSVPISEVRPDAFLHADLGADSVGVIDLMLELEEVFDKPVPDNLEHLRDFTVQEIVNFVTELVGKK